MPRFSAEIAGLELTFGTSLELFSPRNIDSGTAAMLRRVYIESQDKVLDDLGCGYRVVGIYAAHRTDPTSVWLVDVVPVAVEITKRNLRLNGVDGATAFG
jgi:16S rRNA (guanine1207-N2)-methyltransferase